MNHFYKKLVSVLVLCQFLYCSKYKFPTVCSHY